ncbi:MAG: cystathionine beta-lyase [Thalassobaculaceae bacterium]
MTNKNAKFRTRLTHAGRHPSKHFGAVNPPVFHASTILASSLAARNAAKTSDRDKDGNKIYRYGRVGTPTSDAFEEAVAAAYQADDAIAVSSGMAAIACALQAVVSQGDHILVADTVYRPTRNYCETYLTRMGVETTYYDPKIGAGIADLITARTAAIYVESPGSLTFEIMDIPAVAAVAKARKIPVMMDNTWASAMYFSPFEKGVDIVIEAVTKYICGHSDVMMGVMVANAPWAEKLRAMARLQGQCCGPDDLYLAQRGLRTLAVRMKQNEANALALAAWLETRPEVAEVRHPGLPSHPDHALWQRDFSGSSGLFSIVLHPISEAAFAAMVDDLELYGIGASWGGFESLVLNDDPSPVRSATRWAAEGPLLRIHAGLEDIDDLKADLSAGFARLSAAVAAE